MLLGLFMYNYQIGNLYSFETQPSGILPTNVSNAKLMSICDFNTAEKFEEVRSKAQQILSLMPIGTWADPELLYLSSISDRAKYHSSLC